MTSKVTSPSQRGIFFLLIVYVLLATSRSLDDEATAETSPCPPVNSCPNDLSTDAIRCTPSSKAPPPPPHDGGDLHPVPDMMGDQELSTSALTEAVVLALLTARKEDRTKLEIFFILVFPSAVFALVFFEIPLRNTYPRFTQIIVRLVVIFFVNGATAFTLPAKFLWVPALCLGFSVLALIIAPPASPDFMPPGN